MARLVGRYSSGPSGGPGARVASDPRATAMTGVGLALAALVALLAAVPASAAVSLTWSEPVTIDSSAVLRDVACPSSTQCTAIAGYGSVITFNPASPGKPKVAVVDSTATDVEDLDWIACPAATQCTASTYFGGEVTFNPTAPVAMAPVTIDDDIAIGLSQLACPSQTQCTAVDGGGLEVTFDPQAPAASTPVTIGGQDDGVDRIACPSVTRCTTIDDAGDEFSFDPQSPGHPSPVKVDGHGLESIACPTASQCTAVDPDGNEVTFDPASPGKPTPVDVDGTDSLQWVACPTTSQCTADSGFDGTVATFDPLHPGTVTPVQVGPGQEADLNAVLCVSSDLCAILADGGDEYIGRAHGGAARASVVKVRASGSAVAVSVACAGPLGTQCAFELSLASSHHASTTFAGKRLTLAGGRSKTVRLRLDRTGRRLLGAAHRLAVTVSVTANGKRLVAKHLTLH